MVGLLRKYGVALVFPVVLLGAAACAEPADDGVATAGGETTSSSATGPAPATDRAERQRQYAECLRQHGIEVADAEAGKDVEVRDTDTEAAKEAARACQRYAPDSDAAKAGQDVAALREYASCMRANGVVEFPDPDPDGELSIPKTILNSPEFDAADRACTSESAKPGK
jgi:hypothetical protein